MRKNKLFIEVRDDIEHDDDGRVAGAPPYITTEARPRVTLSPPADTTPDADGDQQHHECKKSQ